jgi:sphingolipid delta-4 desaturase
MTIHETTHNLVFPTSAQNIVLALFANVPMVLPVAMTFRRYHPTHHAQLGVRGRDTDLPHPLEVRFIGRSRALKAVWWFFYAFVYVARAATFTSAPNRREWLNFALVVGVDAAIVATMGSGALLYLFLSTVFAHGLHPVAAHFIHEHYIFSPGQETYSYYGPLNAVTFNVGYHVEHHDFPNVPGWQLPRLHRLAREHYAPLISHRSWTHLLWKFISDGSLGFGSRIIRKSVHAP